MHRSVLFAIILAVFPTTSHACIVFIDENPASTSAVAPTALEALNQRESRQVWQQRADERQQGADKQWDFRSQNNLCAALAHLGRLDEALDRMQTVERVYPGQRETASNLGTVYELKGDLTRARFWIAEGIRRERTSVRPSSIDGSEWLHLRILDAEIRAKTDPGALQSQAVSGLDFGNSQLPDAPKSLPQGNSGAKISLSDAQNALQEQLHERLEFVHAPSPIVGDLLFDFGNALAVAGRDQDARDIYKMALDFAPFHAALAQIRFDYFAGTPNYTLDFAFYSLALSAVGVYFWRKKWLEAQKWRTIPVQDLDALGPAKRTAFIDCSRYNPLDRD